jgi:CRP/FNR family cyclic AMP-dependent transcriptional regulator
MPPAAPARPEDLLASLAGASDALRALAARGEQRRYRRDSVLINEGEAGDTLYIVLAGRLRAFASGYKDREITYGVYGPGEYLGEMSLDGGPRSASVITLEPSVCALVTRRTLEQHIAEYPQFAFELLAKVIRRARAATLSAKQMALNDVYGRLGLMLNALAQTQPDGTRVIAERLTHQEIAHRLGCSREMVSRLMKDLARGGYVRGVESGLRIAAALPPRW